MAQNLLDRLDESIGMEEYDLASDISDAAMQRGISPVEMRGQLIQTMLQEDGKTISDRDRDLYAMGEISLAEAVKRSTVDRTLKADAIALEKRMSKGLRSLPGRFINKLDDWSEYVSGDPRYHDAEAGMGRTLSDMDQALAPMAPMERMPMMPMMPEDIPIGKGVERMPMAPMMPMEPMDQIQALAGESGRTISSRDFHKQIMDNLQGILNEAVPGKNISDRDRQFLQTLMGDIENKSRSTLPLGSYFTDQDRQRVEEIKGRIMSDQDLSGRTLSNQDLAIGRTMSDQDQQNEFLPRRVAGFRNHLQDVLDRSGATISDADREFLRNLIGSPVDPNTLSDRDQRILSDIKLGRTHSDEDLVGMNARRDLSDSDAAILEMLK